MSTERALAPIQWDQHATLIDLDGTAPFIGAFRDCVAHFSALKAAAKADARILLTQPTGRPGRRTRTWVLNPDEIAALVGHAPDA